jgi:hypothetical protein
MMGKNRKSQPSASPTYHPAKRHPRYGRLAEPQTEEPPFDEQVTDYPYDAGPAEAQEEDLLEELAVGEVPEEPGCEVPAAEELTEEPALEELMAKTQIDKWSCNKPVRATAPSVDPYFNEPLIEAASVEANSCDEDEKSEDTRSDVSARVAPKHRQSNIAVVTPASTQDGDIEHVEKLFLCCAQCTRMVLITTGEACPFTVLGIGKAQNRSSLAMTTCRSCEKANKSAPIGYKSFRDRCTRNFVELRLSPMFLQGSHLFRVAERVAGDHVEILQERGGIRYVDMGGLLEEMTNGCTMRGVRHDVTKEGLSKEDLVMPFLPGAFV